MAKQKKEYWVYKCDECKREQIMHVDVEAPVGWMIEGEMYYCPMCGKFRPEASSDG